MGYPPFLWACGLIIAIVNLGGKLENQTHKLLLGLLGLTLVNYTYPLLSPVLILILLYEVSKMTKLNYSYLWIHKKAIGTFVLITCVLNFAVVIKSLNVRNYLDDAGGIQPTELRTLILIVLAVIIMSFSLKRSPKTMPLIVMAFFASVLNFSILALWSQINLDEISYYPQKAGYLALILGFASMGNMIGEISQFSKFKNKQLIAIIAAATSISLLWFSVAATSNPKYAKYGFPSTKVVWDQLRHNPPNPRLDCFLNAMDITSDLNSNSDLRTILYLADDLGTRWINGVRGRLTEATYSLSIPVGQGNQALSEILENWFDLYPRAQLLILAPEPPVGLEKWGNRIEFRQLVCA